jgi:hypothetical protein
MKAIGREDFVFQGVDTLASGLQHSATLHCNSKAKPSR